MSILHLRSISRRGRIRRGSQARLRLRCMGDPCCSPPASCLARWPLRRPCVPARPTTFRAAFATSQDVAEGKRLADASCARCHGANGISTAKGVPHLAGQRAVFLHQEMKAYKSGARGKSMMADAAKFLSDDALIKVAAWYAHARSGTADTAGHAEGRRQRTRSRQRRQGRRFRLRQLPRRNRDQQDSRNAQPRRASIPSTWSRPRTPTRAASANTT